MVKTTLLVPTLLCKACQSGKTSEAFDNWIKEQNIINDKTSNERKIGIFICDNSLLLTKQTNIRAQSDNVNIMGDIVTMSSKDQINKVKKLYKDIIKNQNLTTILCCGNGRRLKDLTDLFNLLENEYNKYKIYIYVDEADKILHSKNAKEQLKIWREHSIISKITLITATPQENETKGLAIDFGTLSLMSIKNITQNNYHYLRDSNFIDTSSLSTSSNLDNVEQVFKNYITNGPTIGDVWFIPGEHKTETHDAIEEKLFELGFNCVLKINGKQKQITYLETIVYDTCKIKYKVSVKTFNDIHEEIKHGADDIKFSPYNNELSRWLERYYIRNNGKKLWKFAIIGNMCISRGISIQSPECLITHAIYGPNCAHSASGRYQMFARVCGNIKEFPSYKELGAPSIYASYYLYKSSCQMEEQAIKLSSYSQIKNNSNIETVDAEFITSLSD